MDTRCDQHETRWRTGGVQEALDQRDVPDVVDPEGRLEAV